MSRKNIIEIIKLIQAGLTQDDYGKSKKRFEDLIKEVRFEDLIKEVEKPITLADFLGWEEGVAYEIFGKKLIIKDDGLWFIREGNLRCSTDISWSKHNITTLRQAKKVEKKPKAYHVKDEYSLYELIKELKEQGAFVDINFIKYFRDGFIYFFVDDENGINCYRHSGSLGDYDIIEYYREEPKYYAKVKGWELLVEKDDIYWNYSKKSNELCINDIDCRISPNFVIAMTINEWSKLGINDTNADFEEVE
ncbi:hypothetical protein [Helcococcus bovis]|uniref:hypothetical protein n=1 Tax=Helcococcus bovis TaxID=3153252 RepID=UPI0038BDF3BE